MYTAGAKKGHTMNVCYLKSKSKIETRAFSVAGPTVFNSLPETVKNSTSMIEFRKLLKTFLFGQAYGI